MNPQKNQTKPKQTSVKHWHQFRTKTEPIKTKSSDKNFILNRPKQFQQPIIGQIIINPLPLKPHFEK